jgi:hypothetical protein
VRRCDVHHVEVLAPGLDGPALQALGFRATAVPTYRAALHPDDESRTFAALAPSARRNVRRGERLGLEVRYEEDPAFVAEHYDQLREVCHRRGTLPTFGRSRMEACFRHLHAAGRLIAVSVRLPADHPEGPVCIASGLFTADDRELLLWSWAHRTRHRWYRPTELMTWTVMRRAMAAGCVTFDLMGRGDFKAKLGGQLESDKQRWVWTRYGWLGHARDAAEASWRMRARVLGGIRRLTARGEGER